MGFLQIERFFQQKIFPELEKGRPNWDKPHTQAVVHYLKKILSITPNLVVDKIVLLIAAYAHDWGYSRLYSNGQPVNIKRDSPEKIAHMTIGAQKVTELLQNDFFNFLTKRQKQHVVHLVKIHDRLERLTTINELILMEADTLGGLDTNFVKPTLDPQANKKYLNGIKKIRLAKFITNYSKKEFKRLFKLRQNYYDQKSFTTQSPGNFPR